MEFRASVTLVNKPGTLKGFASVNIDEQFAVKGIRIVEGENGPFLSMPSRKVGENYEDMCFPVTKECRDKLNETVLKAYEQKLSQKEEQTNEEKQENDNKGSKKQSSSKSQKESADDYEVTVVPATCTELGYSINKCKVCGDEHNSNYVDKIAHAYDVTVTEATCTTMGYSTFVCKDCGDTYKADYVDPKGHTPSEWIVDEAATIEHGGSKHIECTVCGETLQTTDLAQLAGKDNTDEDGKAQVGDYSLILLDENDKPIFNSEIVIDVNDNVSVLLTNGRLLDFDKPTRAIKHLSRM